MGEHQILKKNFTVFFVHPSGPLDLLMYVWVTFGFLIFLSPWGTSDVILLRLLGVHSYTPHRTVAWTLHVTYTTLSPPALFSAKCKVFF